MIIVNSTQQIEISIYVQVVAAICYYTDVYCVK